METSVTRAAHNSSSLQILAARRYGLVSESEELTKELRTALYNAGAVEAFQIGASVAPFEVGVQMERHTPDILFVEFSWLPVSALDWMHTVCAGASAPLVVALHIEQDTAQMIAALRAGAVEFLTLPLSGSVNEAFERIASVLEQRGARTNERGKLIGFVSAKGGCGATTLACHLASALQRSPHPERVLVLDLDYQASAAHRNWRVVPTYNVTDAFNAVRRLNSAIWPEFVSPVGDGVDFLAGPTPEQALPEPWRIETLFRFLIGHYKWVLADLGRQLHPANWSFLDNIDQLYVVTAPDVLALYQTRSMLQTLTSRGFERARLRLILNRNESGPRDFWVESIKQMFEMEVAAAIPDDFATIDKLPRDRYEFPQGSPFGKSVLKLAGQMVKTSLASAGKGV